jgi:DNA-binding MarR family transcriptional regulator
MTEQEIKLLLSTALTDMLDKVLRLQEQYVSYRAHGNVSRTEMHTLEVVRNMPDATLTQISETLSITKATASVSVNRLVIKGFLVKTSAIEDRRINILRLTETGETVHSTHRQFHDRLFRSILRDFHISEYPKVLKSMQSLGAFFRNFRL